MQKRTFNFLIISILFFYNNAKSQIGLQESFIKQSGMYGYYLKPAIGHELIYKFHDYETKFNMGFSLGLCKLNTRSDTFPDYTLQSGGFGTILLPGYIIYKNYFMYSFGILMEYKFLEKNFTPLIGFDLYVNIHLFDWEHKAETFINESTTNENVGEMAIIPRVAVKYELKETWVFSAGIGRSIGIILQEGKHLFWKPYISVIYYYE